MVAGGRVIGVFSAPLAVGFLFMSRVFFGEVIALPSFAAQLFGHVFCAVFPCGTIAIQAACHVIFDFAVRHALKKVPGLVVVAHMVEAEMVIFV